MVGRLDFPINAKRYVVICKNKMHCNCIVLCIRVIRTTIYRVKTLFHKHKCRKQFFIKNAKVILVAKVIVDKLKNNIKMKLNEMVSYVRLVFVTEITGCKDFKARKLARQIVEGDSSKQYNLLWSYDAELSRVSLGNTFKLNIRSP